MALNSLFCADVPLSNYSLTHWSSAGGLSLHCVNSLNVYYLLTVLYFVAGLRLRTA